MHIIDNMRLKIQEYISPNPDADVSVREKLDRMVSLLSRIPYMYVEFSTYNKKIEFTYMDFHKSMYVADEVQCLHFLEWLGKGEGRTVYLMKDGASGWEGFLYRFPPYDSADQLEMTCLVKGW